MDGPVADSGLGLEVFSGAGGWLVVCISEAGAPVAEVRADDEDICGIREVGCEMATESAFGVGRGIADHYGDEEGEVLRVEVPS